MYKVSVIVPIYNTEKYLQKCLESLVNQTLEEIEIILVNDSSPDNSQIIIDEYVSKYPDKIKSYIKENGGQASARNLGIKKAKGEYIGFVDSDDWIELDMYEQLYNKAISENLDIVCCNTYKIENELKTENPPKEMPSDNMNKNYIILESGPCNKLINRKLFMDNNLKFLEGHIYEDLALIPTIALYTDKIGYIDSYLYNYLIREGSTMNQIKYNKKLEDIFDVMEELDKKFQNNYKEELEYIYIQHLLHDASLRFLIYKEGKDKRKKINVIMRQKFPDWENNQYLKQQDLKYQSLCKMLYKNNSVTLGAYKLLRKIKGYK